MNFTLSPAVTRFPSSKGANVLSSCCSLAISICVAALACVSLTVQAANVDVNWPPLPVEQEVVVRSGDTVTFIGDFATTNAFPVNATFTSSVGPPVGLPTGQGNTFPPSVAVSYSGPGAQYYYAAYVGGLGAGTLRPDLGKLTVTVLPTCPTPTSRLAVMDIDGDGSVQATTDGLLLTRYALGMRGNALVTNAIGANASRCTYLDIEFYLLQRVVP